MIRKDAINLINTIYDKYETDPFMLSKLQNYITIQLPNMLETTRIQHVERVARIGELTQVQDQFIDSFLTSNQYFYVSSTENFFTYNGVNYQLQNEDDVLYHVLSSISKERQLSSWKQSTKNTIMKRIRENYLLKSIPESETIQYVIDSLCPLLFKTRTEAKYFLTILGDNIFRKNTNLIHYISSNAKHFIKTLNNISQMLFGQGLSQTFKHKFHDHEYSDCRVLNITSYVKSDTLWNSVLTQIGLDILCVACHYSIRYESSDEFVNKYCNDMDLQTSVFYLKNNTSDDLVNMFISEYLSIESSGKPLQNQLILSDNVRVTKITWKNMQYLWKYFLESKNLPPVMFLQTLKANLTNKLSIYYKEDLDSFVGICSKHLPEIQKFLQFWEETVSIDNAQNSGESEFEIDEIIILFRKWCNTNNEVVSSLNDKEILDLISYFYPSIEIERDKYILNIRSTLWDKQMDIQVALQNLKEHLSPLSNKEKQSVVRNNVSIYDAYLFYCKYYSNSQSDHKQIVSKSYFEKYIFENLNEFIIESKFLSSDWYQ